MKNNETGEFELVMGNRQLLSGFFIVCLLFGVAFAMGYIVGRNSSPSARALSEMTAPAQAPVVSDSRPAPSGAVVTPPPAEGTDPAKPADGGPAGSAATAQAGGTQPAGTQPAGTQPVGTQPVQTLPIESPAATTPSAVTTEPAAGNYWQVMAVKQPEAEVVVQTLKDKGFPASLSPGPNNLVRVLVGPYNDRDSLGKAKAELENAGFHPILKR
jgi:cell division septation protein DedD